MLARHDELASFVEWKNHPVNGSDRGPVGTEVLMAGINLREKWMKDPEYRRAHFEGEPALRVAVHVIRFRNEAGLTQKELAERMKKKQSWISRVEAGEENLTLKTLGQLAYALEKDLAEFLQSVDMEPPVPRFVWVTQGAGDSPDSKSNGPVTKKRG